MKSMPAIAKMLRLSACALLLVSACTLCLGQDKKAITYGILLDDTGSMRTQFSTVLDIGKGIVHQVREHGPVSVFDFASQGIGRTKAVPTPRIENTRDEELLNRTIDNLYVQGGQTTLLDAIQFIGERLRQESANADQVIILVTDGEERSSQIKQKELVQQLKDWKIKVFAVGLVQELESGKRSKAIDLLNLITKETGGRAVFPKSRQAELQSLVGDLGLPTP